MKKEDLRFRSRIPKVGRARKLKVKKLKNFGINECNN